MKKVYMVLALTCWICLCSVGYSFANGVLRDGMGPISSGRGGTNLAHIDNGILIYDNPSALTEMKGKRIEADFDFMLLTMNYEDPDNDEDGKDTFSFMPSLSYSQELVEDLFSFGLGVYHPAGFSTEYDLVHSVYGEQKYASDAFLTKILFGLGWKISDQFSIGVAIGPAYCNLELEKPWTFQTTPGLVGAPVLMDLEGDDWALAWNVGAQWRISPNTTFGLAYHCQDKFHMSGDLNLDTIVTTAHYDLIFDFSWPQSLGVGFTHRFKDVHRISADVKWVDWSSAFDEITFKLSHGNNAVLNGLAGSKPQDTLPLDWKDSYSYCFGYEYFLGTANILRLGYTYTENPVPSSTLIPVIPGILKHLISVGYSHNWKSWTFDIAYQYFFGSRQTVKTSEILGGDYDNSSVEIDAHHFGLGIQYQF